MKLNIYNNRVLTLANYILKNNSTIRATAQHFGMAKSTVHHDLHNKLYHINTSLYHQVYALLQNNFNNKHINGGIATKIKYEKLKESINKNDELDAIS